MESVIEVSLSEIDICVLTLLCVFAGDSVSSIHLFNHSIEYDHNDKTITRSIVVTFILKGPTSYFGQQVHHFRRVTLYSTTTMSDKRSERMLEELLKVPGNSKSIAIDVKQSLHDSNATRYLVSCISQLADFQTTAPTAIPHLHAGHL